MLSSLYRKIFEMLRSSEAVCAKYGHDKRHEHPDFGHGSPWKCMRCGFTGIDGHN